MKLVHCDLVRNGPGSIKLVPEEEKDLWHAYKLIDVGDNLQPDTVGKVLREVASGGRDAEYFKIQLEIVVESVRYDTEGSFLRVCGKNITENDHVKIGELHTLELELTRPFVLQKEIWDQLALETAQQACDLSARADLAAILMKEGLAHIFLVGRSMIVTKARIETFIPRNHGSTTALYELALQKFFEHVLQALLEHIDFDVVQYSVIASPGFTKEQFHDYMFLEAERRDLRVIIENKERLVLAHATSCYKHSLKEVLDIVALIKDTKAAHEVVHELERTPSPTPKRRRRRRRSSSSPPTSSPEKSLNLWRRPQRSSSSPPSPDRKRSKDNAVTAPTNPCKHPAVVFWDAENCSVPKYTVAKFVADRIRSALNLHPEVDSVEVKAYGPPQKIKKVLQKTGVTVIDIPNRRKDAVDKLIIADMLLFACDTPRPAIILLISGDGDFTPAVRGLVKRGYTVIVTIPSQCTASKALMRSASHVWDWPRLAKGRGIKVRTPNGQLEALKHNMIFLFESNGGHVDRDRIAEMYHKSFGKKLKLADYGAPELTYLFRELVGSPFCVIGEEVFLIKQPAFEEGEKQDHEDLVTASVASEKPAPALNAAFVNAEGDPYPSSQDTTIGEILKATNQEIPDWFRGAAAAQQGRPNGAVDHFFHMRGLRGLYTTVELSFSATKLRNSDAFSKSDPMLVVYTNIEGKLEEIGRTEVILNSLEPSWITKATMSYQFEIVQPLVFRIYDGGTKCNQVKASKLDQQDFLGEACCNLSEIVTKFDRSLTMNLQSDVGHSLHGTLTVHAEESESSGLAMEMTLHCLNLENKDVFSKSDPFLRISKLVETADPSPIYETEVVTNNLNPVWRPITLTSQKYGNKDNPLLVECFYFESGGNHELIGSFHTTVTQLENLYTSKSGANFYSHKGQRKMKAQLFVDKLQEKVQHTFLEYISSGFEINFMVAVDFTASNGDPCAPQSLHYIDPSGRRPNSYQQVIHGIGDVLEFYDNDRRFPAWGFGAKTQGQISHCFNLNTATNDCEVVGVDGIMSAYASSLHSVSLGEPTMFGPVINKAAEIASQSLQYSNNKYFVLLIITDGVLTDVQETMDCIVRASDLPLSILVVGVGNADFKQMEILDAFNGKRLESSTGRMATRNIVQFIPMRKVQGGQIYVLQSLLEELPGQFLHYMRSRGIKPQQQVPPGHGASATVYPPQHP